MKTFSLVFLKLVLLLVLLQSVLLRQAIAADGDLESHPGFVDLSSLAATAGTEPTVEVSLKEPLLNLITNILKNENEQTASFISKLLRVDVRVFESNAIDSDRVAASMSEIASNLDSQDWERVVRVREDRSHVDIYFRLSDAADIVHGITVMVSEPGETVMINIAGDISTNDIGALAGQFGIDELAGLDYNNGN